MQVYYYTRTSRSKAIATQIASQYHVSAYQIEDEENWSGPLNYLKGGAMSMNKKTIPITYQQVRDNEHIILVFPVWASNFPPSVLSFINAHDRSNMILVPTSLGTKLKDRDGFIEIFDLVGKEIKAPIIKIE